MKTIGSAPLLMPTWKRLLINVYLVNANLVYNLVAPVFILILKTNVATFLEERRENFTKDPILEEQWQENFTKDPTSLVSFSFDEYSYFSSSHRGNVIFSQQLGSGRQKELVDLGPECSGDGGPRGLRRVDVVPVEMLARVIAQRVLPPAAVVLLPAVAVAAEALAARPPRLREPLRRVLDDEGGEGRAEVEQEERAVGRVERGEHGLESRVVLRGARVGERVAGRVVERAGEERRAPHGVQVGDHHLAHAHLVAQPPQLLPELPHHRRDVGDRGLRACSHCSVLHTTRRYNTSIYMHGDNCRRTLVLLSLSAA